MRYSGEREQCRRTALRRQPLRIWDPHAASNHTRKRSWAIQLVPQNWLPSGRASRGSYHRIPEILGGEPVFTGTRVPVKSLFDHLEAGDSIEQFLEGFPSVKREQVIALLEEAREHALSAS